MKRSLILAGVALLLAGCGGGGADAVPGAASVSPSPGQGTSAQAKFTITIPPPQKTPSSRGRLPQYISSATNSLGIAVGSGAPTIVPLTPTSPGCTTTSGGGRACVVNLGLSAGLVTFTITTYASPNGTGTPLSRVQTTATIVANTTNPIALTLNGVVASLTSSIVPASFTIGQPGTAVLTVNALDPAGQTIVIPPGVLVDAQGNPVTISFTDTDTSGATRVTGTSSPYTVTYNGAAPSTSNVAITAVAASSLGTVASAPPAPLSIAAAQSLYVLNGADQTVSEYTLPLPTGNATPTPRRIFAGAVSSTTCPSQVPPAGSPGSLFLTADALAVGPTGITYVVADPLVETGVCGAPSGTIYSYAPSALPTTAPSSSAQEDNNEIGPAQAPTIALDTAHSLIDVNDNSSLAIGTPSGAQGYILANRFRTSLVLQDQIYSNFDCLVQQQSFVCPAFETGAGSQRLVQGPYLAYGGQFTNALPPAPIAVDRNGNLVVVAEDARGPLVVNPGLSTVGPPAIALIAAASLSPGGPIVTTPTWIEGPHTELSSPVSFAVDANNTLYVLDGGYGANPGYPGNPSFCSAAPQPDASPPTTTCANDGITHFYLLAFDLNALQSGPCAQAGPCDLPPKFILGGSTVARFGYVGTANPLIAIATVSNANIIDGGNRITVGGGLVAVANPTGPTCDPACRQASQIDNAAALGEVDVYNVAGVTGVHFDDAQSAPVTVLSVAQFLNVPAAVAFGPTGTGIGTHGVRRVPISHARHVLRTRFRRF